MFFPCFSMLQSENIFDNKCYSPSVCKRKSTGISLHHCEQKRSDLKLLNSFRCISSDSEDVVHNALFQLSQVRYPTTVHGFFEIFLKSEVARVKVS